MSEFKKGERVRATFEGVISEESKEFWYFEGDGPGLDFDGLPLAKGLGPMFERIEPVYIGGSYYLDARNNLYQFNNGRAPREAWTSFGGESWSYDIPVRPLTRLVVETGE